MARIIVLDSGPLGLASGAPGKPETARCLGWIDALDLSGALVVVPEVADFEVRRELLRCGANAGILRLDRLIATLIYAPITTPAMRLAAEFWASVRRAGLTTAGPQSLDGDCIVAAQAAQLRGHGDALTIATGNPGHLGRFPGVDARPWDTIVG